MRNNQLEQTRTPDNNQSIITNPETIPKKAEDIQDINRADVHMTEKNVVANAKKQSQIGKRQLDESFEKTIQFAQQSLSPSEKILSKIIHHRSIEHICNIIGNTVARQNSIILGSAFAFVACLLSFSIAKNIGYDLSGSEMVISFSLGWLLGLVIDYIQLMVKGDKLG